MPPVCQGMGGTAPKQINRDVGHSKFSYYFPIGVTKIKVKRFQHLDGYRFLLTFENGEYRPLLGWKQ